MVSDSTKMVIAIDDLLSQGSQPEVIADVLMLQCMLERFASLAFETDGDYVFVEVVAADGESFQMVPIGTSLIGRVINRYRSFGGNGRTARRKTAFTCSAGRAVSNVTLEIYATQPFASMSFSHLQTDEGNCRTMLDRYFRESRRRRPLWQRVGAKVGDLNYEVRYQARQWLGR